MTPHWTPWLKLRWQTARLAERCLFGLTPLWVDFAHIRLKNAIGNCAVWAGKHIEGRAARKAWFNDPTLGRVRRTGDGHGER